MEALRGSAPQLYYGVKVLITVWMVAVSLVDARTARIPNWLVGPVMLGVGAIRLLESFTVGFVRLGLLLAWVLVFVLWMLHFIGGGDAKFLMGEYALFPNMEFTAVLAFILLVLTIPLLLVEVWRSGLQRSGASLRDRLLTGQLLPTRGDLEERGRQYAWTFAVPGIVYTWVYW
jgi:Flp pilus assembly protein protease CpaA